MAITAEFVRSVTGNPQSTSNLPNNIPDGLGAILMTYHACPPTHLVITFWNFKTSKVVVSPNLISPFLGAHCHLLPGGFANRKFKGKMDIPTMTVKMKTSARVTSKMKMLTKMKPAESSFESSLLTRSCGRSTSTQSLS